MRRSLQLLRQFETRSTFNVSQTLLAPFATIGPWSATASGCCGLPVQYLPLNEARPVPTATCTPRAFGPNPYLCYMIDWRSPPFSLIAGHYSLSRKTTSGLPRPIRHGTRAYRHDVAAVQLARGGLGREFFLVGQVVLPSQLEAVRIHLRPAAVCHSTSQGEIKHGVAVPPVSGAALHAFGARACGFGQSPTTHYKPNLPAHAAKGLLLLLLHQAWQWQGEQRGTSQMQNSSTPEA
jgi:hypothetical protein